jgi:hypothetical protein
MRHSTAIAILSFALFSCVALGQTVILGNLPSSPNFGFNQTPVTAIDLSNPASQAATLNSAAFTWSATPCPGAVKIKFFRPTPTGSLAFLTERGPFDVISLTQFVFLTPTVDVQAGDLVGIARLTACGSPVGQTPGNPQGFIGFNSDVTVAVTTSQGTLFPNATLSVQATGMVNDHLVTCFRYKQLDR